MNSLFRSPFKKRAPKAVPEAKNNIFNGMVAFHNVAKAQWSNGSFVGLAQEGYTKNPVAHRAIRLICEAAAAVPWQVLSDGAILENHPLLSLLKKPNPQSAGNEFFESLYGHLLLSGNGFLECVRVGNDVKGLYLLRPDRVKIELDKNGWPETYSYNVGKNSHKIPLVDSSGKRGVLHLRLFHPLDDHMGFPPLHAAHMALDIHNAASTWNKALLDNSARPSGALVYAPNDGSNLSDEQYTRLKTELDEGYTGTQRAGRPLLLEGGLEWRSMAMTPQEMDFVEAKNGAARDIALALGVPPMMLGIPGDNTYANYQEANRAFYRLTIIPLLARTAQTLTNWANEEFEEQVELKHELDQISGLASERDAYWKRISQATFLSDEEKRKILGFQ